MARVRAGLLAAALLLGLGGCVSGRPSPSGCASSSDCPPGAICVEDVCTQLCTDRADCAAGRDCVAGLCVPGECATDGECVRPRSCEEAEGARCLNGHCSYTAMVDGVFCNDGDACTSADTCAGGRCVGTATLCETPPEPACSPDDATYVAYPDVGRCDPVTGACSYPAVELACPQCVTACLGRCDGVRCADLHGGCMTLGVCDPTSVTCRYTEQDEGARCDLASGAPGNDAGICQAGDCRATGFLWDASAFGPCSTGCGTGTQSRTVVCRDAASGELAPDASCDAAAKPPTVQACTDASGCTYAWQTSAWGACSTTCGTGTQSRTVACKNTSDGSTVADANCAGGKPAATQSCTATSGCTYAWLTGEWSGCSTTCGVGTQQRTVVCKNIADSSTVSDANCPAPKPATAQGCSATASCTYAWQLSAWGDCSPICGPGSGTQFRRVFCMYSYDSSTVADGYCSGTKPAVSQPCSHSITCADETLPTPSQSYNITGGTAARVFGYEGTTEMVGVEPGVSRIWLDKTVDGLVFHLPLSSYAFLQFGTSLYVYDVATYVLIASIDDATARIPVMFSDVNAEAVLAGGLVTLGGASIPTSVPRTLTYTP